MVTVLTLLNLLTTNLIKTAVFPKIWNDPEMGGCENIGHGTNTDVVECKKECRGRKGCTAINFCHGTDCVFRGCPLPRPAPTWDGPSGWGCTGHHVNRVGKIKQTMNYGNFTEQSTSQFVLQKIRFLSKKELVKLDFDPKEI